MSLDSTLRSRINEIDQTNNIEARLESLEDGQSYLVQRTQDIKLLKDEILRELSGEVRNIYRHRSFHILTKLRWHKRPSRDLRTSVHARYQLS